MPNDIITITYHNKDIIALTRAGYIYRIFYDKNDYDSHPIFHIPPVSEQIFSHINIAFLLQHTILYWYATPGRIIFWDMTTKKLLGTTTISNTPHFSCIAPQDESSLFINNGTQWSKLSLWNKQDLNAKKWIKNSPTLYQAYVLHRLYNARINNHPLEDNDTALKEVETFPQTIQDKLKNYLLQTEQPLERSLLATFNNWTHNTLETGIKFFQSFI